MDVLIVRHADAGDRDEFARTGRPDDERPLSDKGRRQMRGVSKALRKLVPACDLIVTSPYVRAAQTAELLAGAWPGVRVEASPVLTPDTPPGEVADAINASRAAVVALVGHEPDLGHLATWFIAGLEESRIEFKKAGACLLEFRGRARKGAATLRWLMGPRHLSAQG